VVIVTWKQLSVARTKPGLGDSSTKYPPAINALPGADIVVVVVVKNGDADVDVDFAVGVVVGHVDVDSVNFNFSADDSVIFFQGWRITK
jgi:hypothetical protein